MAWEIAIVLAVLGTAALFVFLNQSFAANKQGIKALLILLAVGSNILMAGFLRLIVDAQTIDAGIQAKLDTLCTTYLILSISVFSLFVIYFVITYLVATIRAITDAKKQKEELSWQVAQ